MNRKLLGHPLYGGIFRSVVAGRSPTSGLRRGVFMVPARVCCGSAKIQADPLSDPDRSEEPPAAKPSDATAMPGAEIPAGASGGTWVVPGIENWGPLPPVGLGTASIGSPEFTQALLPWATGPQAPAGSNGGPLATPLGWGPVDVHASLAYQLQYGTGILSAPGVPQATLLQSVTPQLNFELGRHWNLTYAPSAQIYSSSAYRNNVSQLLSLNGWSAWREWRFTAGYGFSLTDNPLVETATQTAQTVHTIHLGAQAQINDRWSWEVGVVEAYRVAENFNNTLNSDLSSWLDYRWRPRTFFGFGLEAGYNQQNPGTDIPTQNLSGRVQGALADKLRYEVRGGVQFLEFLDSRAGVAVSPVANLSLTYTPRKSTSASLFAGHGVGQSYSSYQYTADTSVGLTLQQRLFQRLSLGLTGGYRWTTYLSTLVSDFDVRTDDYAYARVSLNSVLLRRIQVSLFYQYSNNASSRQGYAYDSQQVGFSVSGGF